MKKILQILMLIVVTAGVAQNNNINKWNDLANQDPSLQPEYGNIKKTKEQIESDQEFVNKLLEEYKGDRKKAGQKMIELGFQYLYQKRDLITAMRRFNQAFLINPKDADLYYGFGAVYFNLGGMKQARKQYEKGLEIEPNHFEILTDYGTTYLGEYYNEINSDPSSASKNLDLALEKLRESYLVDENYSSTTYKLSIVYLLKNDCENSRKFLDITKKIDSNVITQDYLNEFNLKCRNDKIDCSTIKTGKFRIDDEEIGITLITRTDNFQIEENENLNYKLKLSITWLDECTYELKPVEDLINPNAELPTMIVTCHVTEINGNSYQQVSSSNESSIKISKEVEILN